MLGLVSICRTSPKCCKGDALKADLGCRAPLLIKAASSMLRLLRTVLPLGRVDCFFQFFFCDHRLDRISGWFPFLGAVFRHPSSLLFFVV